MLNYIKFSDIFTNLTVPLCTFIRQANFSLSEIKLSPTTIIFLLKELHSCSLSHKPVMLSKVKVMVVGLPFYILKSQINSPLKICHHNSHSPVIYYNVLANKVYLFLPTTHFCNSLRGNVSFWLFTQDDRNSYLAHSVQNQAEG